MNKNSFRIVLIGNDDDGESLGFCHDISDNRTQVIREGHRFHKFILYQCCPKGMLLQLCENPHQASEYLKGSHSLSVEMNITGSNGRIYGRHYFLAVNFVRISEVDTQTNCYDIELEGLLECSKKEITLYNELIASHSATPLRYHWSNRSLSCKQALLNVVRYYFCANFNLEIAIKEGSIYEIDGAYIKDIPSFFLAIGEAIRGPYGYFGADLYALGDCISEVRGSNPAFTLVWKNSGISKRYLDEYSYQIKTAKLLYDSMINLNFEHVLEYIIDDNKLRPPDSFFNDAYKTLVECGITVELE